MARAAAAEPPDALRFPASPYPAANVASARQRSPLRYPGGKTWLMPHAKAWLCQLDPRPALLAAPFCSGGIVSLSAAMEGWADRALLGELDRDVAAFWQAALRQGPALAEKVRRFQVSRAAVDELAAQTPNDALKRGCRTLVLNRTRHGRILASGAALAKAGENGQGPASRWDPQTWADRLCAIRASADRSGFLEGDGMALLESALAARGQRIALHGWRQASRRTAVRPACSGPRQAVQTPAGASGRVPDDR